MNAVTPLIGIIILCMALMVNFFRAAWKLGILRAFGRRHALRWRTLIAGLLAACLPFIGAMVAMVSIPAEGPGDITPITAGELAWHLAAAGLVFHLLNDQLMHWGKRSSSQT